MNWPALAGFTVNTILAACHVSRKKYGLAAFHALLSISCALMVAA